MSPRAREVAGLPVNPISSVGLLMLVGMLRGVEPSDVRLGVDMAVQICRGVLVRRVCIAWYLEGSQATVAQTWNELQIAMNSGLCVVFNRQPKQAKNAMGSTTLRAQCEAVKVTCSLLGVKDPIFCCMLEVTACCVCSRSDC